MKDKDINSLDRTTYRCQYHNVFAPKFRRQVIYREIKVDIGKILRQLCRQKGVEIIEAEEKNICCSVGYTAACLLRYCAYECKKPYDACDFALKCKHAQRVYCPGENTVHTHCRICGGGAIFRLLFYSAGVQTRRYHILIRQSKPSDLPMVMAIYEMTGRNTVIFMAERAHQIHCVNENMVSSVFP